jgi:hypothetical protein
MADWQAIKTEYITTQTSYRKLAEKYGIHYKVISERGKAEGWVELRSQHQDKTLTKTLDKISNKQSDKMARIDDLADKLLEKLEKAITELDMEITKRKTKLEEDGIEITTEIMEAKAGGIVDRQGLKQIASALRDIKEVKMLRSELDRQEQEARIANLRKQADKDEDHTEEIEVVFMNGEEAWHG